MNRWLCICFHGWFLQTNPKDESKRDSHRNWSSPAFLYDLNLSRKGMASLKAHSSTLLLPSSNPHCCGFLCSSWSVIWSVDFFALTQQDKLCVNLLERWGSCQAQELISFMRVQTGSEGQNLKQEENCLRSRWHRKPIWQWNIAFILWLPFYFEWWFRWMASPLAHRCLGFQSIK